jgi:hypothetical protein
LDVLRSKHRFRSRLNVDQEFLYRLEDEINRARYEINETYMGQADLRARFHLAAAMEKILSVTEPQPETSSMSITGAANLAGTIKDRINAAKAKVAQVSQNTDSALAKLNDAADTGDKIAKQIEAEADDLLAQIGQFSNGGPE